MRRSVLTLMACLVGTSSALAHPGHGVTEGNSAVHYLLEPLHIGSVVILLAAGITAAVVLKRRKNALKHEHARKR